MKGKKNDFSMTFYNDQERTLFLEYVHNTGKAVAWANEKNIQWTHYVIYDRRTRAMLDRVLKER